jgi:glutathione S-transferase
MMKLYGAPLSNYYNMVKTVLLEKGIEFEEVLTPPSQEDGYLGKSSMGKIPCIETADGFLAETMTILNYLEEIHPEKPMLPADPFQRAKIRELMHSLELYVELVARKGFGALRGKEVADDIKESMKADLPKGVAAVARLTQFSPYIAGDQLSMADLVGYFTFIYADRSAQANIGTDLLDAIPGAKEWFEMVGQRDSVKKALADQAS